MSDIPNSLLPEITEYQSQRGLTRKQAIEELIRLGLIASQQTHTELNYRKQKAG
jgi:hypothetical protein